MCHELLNICINLSCIVFKHVDWPLKRSGSNHTPAAVSPSNLCENSPGERLRLRAPLSLPPAPLSLSLPLSLPLPLPLALPFKHASFAPTLPVGWSESVCKRPGRPGRLARFPHRSKHCIDCLLRLHRWSQTKSRKAGRKQRKPFRRQADEELSSVATLYSIGEVSKQAVRNCQSLSQN